MHFIFRHNLLIFSQFYSLPQTVHSPLISNTSRQTQVCLMAFLYNDTLCWKVTVSLINTEALFRPQLPDAWSSSDTDSTEVTPQVGDTDTPLSPLLCSSVHLHLSPGGPFPELAFSHRASAQCDPCPPDAHTPLVFVTGLSLRPYRWHADRLRIFKRVADYVQKCMARRTNGW